MWIDMEGKLRILTIYENKDYEKQRDKWIAQGAPQAPSQPLPLTMTAYSDDDLAALRRDQRMLSLS
jgi:hypothetical protein